LPLKDGFYGHYQFASSVQLDDVTVRASIQSLFHTPPANRKHSRKEFFELEGILVICRRFNAIELGKADVQQNQVWLSSLAF